MSTRGHASRVGFTLIELLVVIAIIGILAAIIFPVFSGKEKGRQSQCLSNQKQLAAAILMFAQDNEKYPDQGWVGEINLDSKIMVCPDLSDQPNGYGINCFIQGLKADTISRSSDVISDR